MNFSRSGHTEKGYQGLENSDRYPGEQKGVGYLLEDFFDEVGMWTDGEGGKKACSFIIFLISDTPYRKLRGRVTDQKYWSKNQFFTAYKSEPQWEYAANHQLSITW